MGSLKDEMATLAYRAGGSYKTVNDRITIAKRLSDNLYRLNIQIHHVKHLKAKHVVNYVQDRLSQGIGQRTLQNEMAAIRSILQQAEQINQGFACALGLAYQMGLRSQEAVQCSQSLRTWLTLLEKGQTRLPVTFDTKGSRPRETLVLNSELLKQTIQKALKVMEEQKGKLIDKPDLKSAMAYWRQTAIKANLKGEYSPHSLGHKGL